MRKAEWTKTTDGDYRHSSGRALVSDNGAGLGKAKGSGRWAVTVNRIWVANIDTLRVAQRLAVDTVELDQLDGGRLAQEYGRLADTLTGDRRYTLPEDCQVNAHDLGHDWDTAGFWDTALWLLRNAMEDA